MLVWYSVIGDTPTRARKKRELLALGAEPFDIECHDVDASNVFALLDDALSGRLSLKPDLDAMGHVDNAGRKPGWVHMNEGGTNIDDLFN